MGRAKRTHAVHLVTTTRRVGERIYETHLLRRSYRQDGKVKKETVGNISHLPAPIIAVIRAMLAGKAPVEPGDITIEQTLPHGHVAATLAMMRRLEIAELLDPGPSRERELISALIAQRVLAPEGRLSPAQLSQSTLLDELGAGEPTTGDLAAAAVWLRRRQAAVERRLHARELPSGLATFCAAARDEAPSDNTARGGDAGAIVQLLARYVEWHLRRAWRELLEPTDRSGPSHELNAASDGCNLHSLRSLLAELARCTRNTLRVGSDAPTFTSVSLPTRVAQRAFVLVAALPLPLSESTRSR